MDKTRVLEALEQWILDVTARGALATPAELQALPEVARAFLKHHETESFAERCAEYRALMNGSYNTSER